MSEKRVWLKRFNAVDLVTIAVFAVILRFAFLYIYKALYIVFPWNQALFPFFLSLCLAAVLVMVNKPWTQFLWSIAWWLINLFLQGEDPIYAAGLIPVFLVTELVFLAMNRYGGDLKSSLVGNTVYNIGIKVWDWWALVYVFLFDYPIWAFSIVLAVSAVVSVPIGTYLGFALGKRLKTILG
jgi:hypothetical protein